jgi:transposase
METLVERACGLDVHKDTVVACVLKGPAGGKTRKEVRTFPTHTRGLLELGAWLMAEGVTAIAMESTGVYWKPVHAVLEQQSDWQLVIGNARHIRNVPGRKTDVKDAEWLAQLLRNGLIRPSFVPPPAIRELRDLVRARRNLVEDRTRARNRVHKTLQCANIKLDSVASDAFGVSGKAILRAMARGEQDARQLANLAKGRLRSKIDALEVALEGRLSEEHRFLLQEALDHLDYLDSALERLEQRIDAKLEPMRESYERLQQIPGVDATVAATLLAEMGPDMSVFPTAAHAASWAGICPGNHESAGKRQSGRPAIGNRFLKTALCQAAHAASRVRGSYMRDKFYRLKARRGVKKAVLAIGHKILVAAYHVLKTGMGYRDLGEHYLDERDKQRTAKQLVRRLEALGYRCHVTAKEAEPSPSKEGVSPEAPG